MAHESILDELDQHATQRNEIPMSDRLTTLIRVLADERQARHGPEVYSPNAQVSTVFEEVVWGVDHMMKRIDGIRSAATVARQRVPATITGRLRELATEEQWLMGRLEVLHGLLTRLSE